MNDEESRAKGRERARRNRAANPGKVKDSQRRSREKHKDAIRVRRKERDKLYRENNKETAAVYQSQYRQENADVLAKKQQASYLRRKYDLSVAQRDEMLAAQDGRCAICKTDAPGGRSGWHIDHCHASGRVRGLLCARCNLALGGFADDPDLLRTAAAYVENS